MQISPILMRCITHSCEMHVWNVHDLKERDQLLMNRVELIVCRIHILLPVPLDDRCLQERCRSIGIVLKHLEIACPIDTEIKATIDVRMSKLPGLVNHFDSVIREPVTIIVTCLNGIIDIQEAHIVQLLCRIIDLIDKLRIEGVACLLIPIGRTINRVIVHPKNFNPLLPIRTRSTGVSFKFHL